MNNETKKVWFHILNIILIVAAVFAFVVVSSFNSNLKGQQFNHKESSVVQIEDGWTMLNDDGTFTEFNEFGKNLGIESIVLSRIFVFDPEEFIRDTLSFFSSYCAVEVDMGAMMRRLMIGIDGTNISKEYKISCSSGCYADYVPSRNEKAVWDIIRMADAEMYKQKMKDRTRLGSQKTEDSKLD